MPKYESEQLFNRAIASLVLGVELFNRPSDLGRAEGVLIHLHHAFEMLLKAVITECKGTVFDEDGKYSYGFDKCLVLMEQELKLISKDERASLAILDSSRDSAMHYFQDISEDLLYVQAQASVSLFSKLTETAFERKLGDYVPARVLPISTRPPKDIQVLITSDLDSVDTLLNAGKPEAAVAARLRPILGCTLAAKEVHERVQESELARLIKERKEGKDWAVILPEVAQLHLLTEGDGIKVELKIRKEAPIAVRVAAPGEPAVGVIMKTEVNIWDKFNMSLKDLIEKLNLTGPRIKALMLELGTEGDAECFYLLKRRTQIMKGYSKKALDQLRGALEKGMDVEQVWQKHRQELTRRRR